MRFPRQLSHASFSRGLCNFVKRVQLALRYAIPFLVIFKKILNKRYCVARHKPTQTAIIVTFVMTQNFENFAQKSGNFRGQVPFNFDP